MAILIAKLKMKIYKTKLKLLKAKTAVRLVFKKSSAYL